MGPWKGQVSPPKGTDSLCLKRSSPNNGIASRLYANVSFLAGLPPLATLCIRYLLCSASDTLGFSCFQGSWPLVLLQLPLQHQLGGGAPTSVVWAQPSNTPPHAHTVCPPPTLQSLPTCARWQMPHRTRLLPTHMHQNCGEVNIPKGYGSPWPMSFSFLPSDRCPET